MSLAHYQLLKTKDAAVPAEEGYRMAPDEDPPTEVWRKYGLPIFILVAAATLGFLCGTHYQAHPAMEVVPQKRSLDKCPSHLPLLASPPANTNPWAPLSAAEIQDVKTWLFDPHQNLNLTEGRTATVSDNIVFHIETYPPPKDDSLAFLDTSSNETRRAPERYARVTIDHGGLSAPVTRDYVVGPLPTSPKSTTIRRLTEIYHQEDIPFNARGLLDVMNILGPLGTAVAPMSDAVKVSIHSSLKVDVMEFVRRTYLAVLWEETLHPTPSLVLPVEGGRPMAPSAGSGFRGRSTLPVLGYNPSTSTTTLIYQEATLVNGRSSRYVES